MRLVRYIMLNGLLAASLWFGIVEHVEGAAIVAMVLAWFTSVTSLFMLHKDVIAVIRKRGKTVPVPVDHAFDVAVVGFMLWGGWIITGIAYAFHILMIAVAFHKAFKDQPPSSTGGSHVR